MTPAPPPTWNEEVGLPPYLAKLCYYCKVFLLGDLILICLYIDSACVRSIVSLRYRRCYELVFLIFVGYCS